MTDFVAASHWQEKGHSWEHVGILPSDFLRVKFTDLLEFLYPVHKNRWHVCKDLSYSRYRECL